jgi:hypothetical protein
MNFLVAILLSLCLLPSGHAQPCKPVAATHNASQKRVLKQFLAECRQLNYLTPDAGVVLMTTYKDAKGQVN